jgi:hypothetical protein
MPRIKSEKIKNKKTFKHIKNLITTLLISLKKPRGYKSNGIKKVH